MEDKKTMDLVLDDHKKFGKEQVEKALDDLQEYVDGKKMVDLKATENQQWWRLRHWSVIGGETNEAKKAGIEVGSAWAFNSLMNKHAAIMDSFPKPNILPREEDDEEEARILTDIIPAILEQNDYEQIYRQAAWDFCIDGASIKGVFWDTSKHDGLGDVAISNVDVHNLFWKPGISDIQDSDKVFHVTIVDIDEAKARWPKIADKIGPQDSGRITKYIHDDNIDTSQCCEIVDMYYKRTVLSPVYMDGIDEEGKATKVKVHEIPKTVLHLAIFVNDELAFCSENEAGYENGFYSHGQFPFIIARMFPVKDSPWGFGYLDIMKHPQKDIDKLDQAIIKNALMRAKPRYWARKNANISFDEFANWNNEIVEVGTGELGDAVRKIDVDDVPSGAMNHLVNKIEEIKETSGNRDFNQGGVANGVTSAAAISALQEAGSALARDCAKEMYRAERELYHMIIELIRQFYAEPRSFRTMTENGDLRFIQFSNAGIVERDTMNEDGSIRHVRPVFDITVSAEKQSPFSRAAQNETAKELYGMGLFEPERAIPALVCLDMMDFEGKEKVKQQIQQNAVMLQQYQSAMQLIQQLSMMNPQIAAMAMQAGLTTPEQMAMMQTESQQIQQNAQQQMQEGNGDKGLSYADKIRRRVAEATSPM